MMTRLHRRLKTSISCGLVTLAIALASPAAAQPIAYRIENMSLSQALREYGRVSGRQIIFTEALVRGRTAPRLVGVFEPNEALAQLLAGSGLRSEPSPTGVVMIVRAGEAQAAGVAANEDGPAVQDAVAENIVVTGSRIRGAAPDSPVVVLSAREMRDAGQSNLGDVIRSIPQNFSGGQNPGVLGGAQAGGSSNINSTAGSSLNLRGLGPDASLTLLNGTRLPYDSFTQATDVSAIPVAAIERIEILLDGASAIYGSDAVGGVANIILRRDFSGADLSTRYGLASQGGYEQAQVSGVAGQTWGTGGIIATADYSRNSPVRASQRAYLSYLQNQGVFIFPRSEQTSLLLSGHQVVLPGVEINIDAFYTDRDSDSRAQSGTARQDTARASRIWGIAPSIRIEGPASWNLRLTGFVGRNRVDLTSTNFSIATGAQTSQTATCYCNRSQAIGIEAEGPLIGLPAGEVRASAGAGYRRNELEIINLLTGAIAGTGGSDASRFAFGEVRIPIIDAAQGVPLIRSLALSGAVRYEDYDSFGDVFTPKVGATWKITADLSLRGNWGRSFKVPTLFEQFTDRGLSLYPGTTFGAPAGTTVIYASGGNPELQPERAEILTLGAIFRPRFVPGLSIDLGWFDIDYRGRIANPPVNPVSSAFTNPGFAEFVTRNPGTAAPNAAFAAFGLAPGTFTNNYSGAPYSPANLYGIVINTPVNAVSQRVRGMDLLVQYRTGAFGGQLGGTLNASWLQGERQLTAALAPTPTEGISFFPPAFRARAGLTWSDSSLTLSGFVNHLAGVRNINVTPAEDGDAMTTVDLVAIYRFGNGFEGSISASNLFDTDPPYLRPAQTFYVNYDSSNYSALGRVVSLTLTKRF